MNNNIPKSVKDFENHLKEDFIIKSIDAFKTLALKAKTEGKHEVAQQLTQTVSEGVRLLSNLKAGQLDEAEYEIYMKICKIAFKL